MTAQVYDIVTIGGGIAASSLAKAMAERGAKVLVLEREKQFKDRGAEKPSSLGAMCGRVFFGEC